MSNVGQALIREARFEDVGELVALLADDPIGAGREDTSESVLHKYQAGFRLIQADPHCRLLVAEQDGMVIGSLQINILSGLSYQAINRCILEDMRVRKDKRDLGVGKKLVEAALAFAKTRQCALAELFVHDDRDGAQRFYEACGFTGEHRGYRREIS